MEETMKGYLEQTKIGRSRSCKNLTVSPLLSDYSVGLDFLLLAEAPAAAPKPAPTAAPSTAPATAPVTAVVPMEDWRTRCAARLSV